MPLYEYECRSCQSHFEQLVYDRAAEVVCRTCGSEDVTQVLSTFAVGSSTARAEPQSNPCAGCKGNQGGICPMDQ